VDAKETFQGTVFIQSQLIGMPIFILFQFFFFFFLKQYSFPHDCCCIQLYGNVPTLKKKQLKRETQKHNVFKQSWTVNKTAKRKYVYKQVHCTWTHSVGQLLLQHTKTLCVQQINWAEPNSQVLCFQLAFVTGYKVLLGLFLLVIV